MSRLLANMKSAEDTAAYFVAEFSLAEPVPETFTEGDPAFVIYERPGGRRMKAMLWGFPRRAQDGADRIGLVADLTNPMWEETVHDVRYRCLIPITHFANPAGDAGEKTRTWFRATDEPLYAWGGFCRNTPEFGPVFAGMTMPANELVMPYNDRMPALVARDEWHHWLQGPIQNIIYFQIRPPLAPEAMTIEHTEDLWRSGKSPPMPDAQFALI